MGETGVGKTTLINAMVNYILGVEFGDPFRFLLISDEGTSKKSQAYSQTNKVIAYELLYQEGFKIPYSLIIVDTPGYCDTNSSTTNGIDRDAQITDAIQQFFKDKKGIQVSSNQMIIKLDVRKLTNRIYFDFLGAGFYWFYHEICFGSVDGHTKVHLRVHLGHLWQRRTGKYQLLDDAFRWSDAACARRYQRSQDPSST